MARKTRAEGIQSLVITVMALALPTLSLIPLGGWMLWERGWVVEWTIGSALLVATVLLITRRLGRPADDLVIPSDAGDPVPLPDRVTGTAAGDVSRGIAREELAFRAVRRIAETVKLDDIQSREDLFALGVTTVARVADIMHEGRRDAVWQFTLPQGLAITERVSQRLGRFVTENVPFGSRLTLAQVIAAYRARGLINAASWAYDAWRVVRIINPATAATQEARDRLSKALFNWSRDQVARRIVERYVEEVGRAAIDLYSGRLKVSSASTDGGQTGADQSQSQS